ncbi:GAF domain-containing protein [Methylobacterium sp. Leaf113]|uniref:GAF domain-containing protein n=1 Tax=Methylobacterium sp. Leaf113 TaxID=1736259 RepID=UPI0009E802CE|nr:GAF domain-containing protein [Methylobacterium sp. Leaf113]
MIQHPSDDVPTKGGEDVWVSLGLGDPDRIAALERYRILDTPADEAFDSLVRLASQLCGTPVGLITLVASDRQWFKARVGFERSETGLDRSICIHTLPEPSLLVIPDLALDPRTQANPVVTGEAPMRFYAAVPLRTPCGFGLGTLCVLDREPRDGGLTVAQEQVLRTLGMQVMALMEARRALCSQEESAARLQSSEAFLKGVLAASQDCIKVLDLDGRLASMNEPGLRAMEIDDFAPFSGMRWPPLWSGPDEERAEIALRAARAGGVGRFAGWAETRRGRRKFWDVMVTPINGVDGRPERILAVSRDLTAARLATRRQMALTRLSDRLRGLTDPEEVGYRASETAGRTLGLCRAAYGVVDTTASGIAFERDWTLPGHPTVVGSHRYADYGRYVEDLRRGTTVVIRDIGADPRTASRRDALGQYGIGALVNVPAMTDGRLVGVLCLHDAEPRDWTTEEVAFAEAVAERARLAMRWIAAEEQQQLRTREISHRFKNLLAIVQAIATQTMRSANDLTAASEVLAGRLSALGQSQDLLLDGQIGSSPLLDVVKAALHLHTEAVSRFDLSGPEVRIGGKVTLSLSVMLHELATNAAKYGALANGTGRVVLSWNVLGEDDAARLRLTWREIGGPKVAMPSRKGFGSRLIERGLAGQVGGVVELSYDPTGLVFSVEAPLAAFQAEV